MSDGKKPNEIQLEAISFGTPYIQESFDLNRMDNFVKSLGTTFYHWKATPSPIGLNDRGDLRRNNGVDVMTSNGYIYTLGGKFKATMVGNQRDQKRPAEGALIDSSTSNLVLPRFYDNDIHADPACCEEGKPNERIRLTPGDRLYHDPKIDDLVVNKELLTYYPNSPNVAMYPIVRMDMPIVDSRGIYYKENIDFQVCKGNIEWIEGRPNPGIDPDTGEGRTYSIRYLYRAFYYVTSILREVRVTDVTEDCERNAQRMPMFVQIQREYLYHNINRGNEVNKPPTKPMENRQTIQPPENIGVPKNMVRVEQTDIENDT
jgi:hypothetical protein